MITAGVDVGTRFLKICIVEEESIIGASCYEMNSNFDIIFKKAYAKALEKTNIKKKHIKNIVSTGYGAHLVKRVSDTVGEHICISKGLFSIDRSIRTIIDVGGFFIRVITLDAQGTPVFNHINEKCAAGSGKFLEMISEAIDIPFDKISEYASGATNMLTLTSSCAVFAESDIISQVNSGKSANDIIASVVCSISSKVATLFKHADALENVAISGGVSKIPFFIVELEKILNRKLLIPDLNPQVASAYGAAIIAREKKPVKKYFFL